MNPRVNAPPCVPVVLGPEGYPVCAEMWQGAMKLLQRLIDWMKEDDPTYGGALSLEETTATPSLTDEQMAVQETWLAAAEYAETYAGEVERVGQDALGTALRSVAQTCRERAGTRLMFHSHGVITFGLDVLASKDARIEILEQALMSCERTKFCPNCTAKLG